MTAWWGKPFKRPEGELEPVKPISEPRPAHIPYRGGMYHGVAPDPAARMGEVGYGAVPGNPEDLEPEKPRDAVPVRIVQGDDSRERRETKTGRFTLGTTVERVLPEDSRRYSAFIRNGALTNTPADAIIVWNENGSPSNGFLIPAGAVQEIKGMSSLFAQTAGATSVEVYVLTEYTRG